MSYINSQSNFLSGEVSFDIISRADLSAYNSGLSKLTNMNVLPIGAIERREGLKFLFEKEKYGKLIPYIYNPKNKYLLYLSDRKLEIYKETTLIKSLSTPYLEDELFSIRWVYKGNKIIFAHTNHPLQILTRYSNDIWSIKEAEFERSNDGFSLEPFLRVEETKNVALTPSAVTGNITITANDNLFTPEHVGSKIQLNEGEIEITAFNTSQFVNAKVNVDLASTTATKLWYEQAFSKATGYPTSLTFHQDRLVLGGNKAYTNRLWFSKTGDYFNYDLGSGLDDEAIEFNVFSGSEEEIVNLYPGKHLLIFTTSSEWMVTGAPLTPTNLQLRKQSEIGSFNQINIYPVLAEGAVLFISSDREDIREFIYTDLEDSYQSTDLAILVKHMLKNPISMTFDKRRKRLYVINEDGSMVVGLLSRKTNTVAWFEYKTEGEFKSLCTLGNKIYAIIKRGIKYSIECFDSECLMDAYVIKEYATPKNIVDGLNYLEGKTVTIIADGNVIENKTVTNGEIILNDEYEKFEIGLPFTHFAAPLPPMLNGNIPPKKVRMIEATFRVLDTKALEVDMGKGVQKIVINQFNDEQTLDEAPTLFSKDIRIKALGWTSDFNIPLWKIKSKTPLPCKVISVSNEYQLNR
jgi:hypothetical protein